MISRRSWGPFLVSVFLIVVADGTPAWAIIPASERQALIVLYNNTNGADWQFNDGWLGPPGTECDWYGVYCDAGKSRVIQILLDSNRLDGALPPSIGNFEYLRSLRLGRNPLTGPIPAEIGSLPNLESLSLYQNTFSGSIPPEIGDLSALRFLTISSIELSGAFPPEIGNLSSLESLVFSEVNFSGVIPPEIGNLESLTYLNLGHNHLSGPIPPEIGNLSNLKMLYLDHNHLSGSIPPEIGNLGNLHRLYLNHNHLSGLIPAEFGNLSSLYFFDLDGNRLVGEVPNSLVNLTRLSYGDLYFNALYTSDPELVIFLDRKVGADWADLQTVAPDAVTAERVTDHTVWLTWTPVTYYEPGGYEVFVTPTGTDTWISAKWTASKRTTMFPVTGLDPGTSYDLSVASFTHPIPYYNPNLVFSDLGETVMATTSNLGCEAPTIVVDREDEITLSLDVEYDSYNWSTSESTPTIEVDPESPEWYWVTVTWDGGCEETASVLVRPKQRYVEQVEAE